MYIKKVHLVPSCPAVPEKMEENWSEDDEMFVFRKEMAAAFRKK